MSASYEARMTGMQHHAQLLVVMGVSWTFFKPIIPQSSIYQLARITNMSHKCPVSKYLWKK
jgi:hypothetical protein